MKRGEIWLVSLDPSQGHAPNGRRPVLVVSPEAFNRATRVPVVLPITSGGNFARTAGFAVSLTGAGTKTTGVVRCGQPRASTSAHLAVESWRACPTRSWTRSWRAWRRFWNDGVSVTVFASRGSRQPAHGTIISRQWLRSSRDVIQFALRRSGLIPSRWLSGILPLKCHKSNQRRKPITE